MPASRKASRKRKPRGGEPFTHAKIRLHTIRGEVVEDSQPRVREAKRRREARIAAQLRRETRLAMEPGFGGSADGIFSFTPLRFTIEPSDEVLPDEYHDHPEAIERLHESMAAAIVAAVINKHLTSLSGDIERAEQARRELQAMAEAGGLVWFGAEVEEQASWRRQQGRRRQKSRDYRAQLIPMLQWARDTARRRGKDDVAKKPDIAAARSEAEPALRSVLEQWRGEAGGSPRVDMLSGDSFWSELCRAPANTRPTQKLASKLLGIERDKAPGKRSKATYLGANPTFSRC